MEKLGIFKDNNDNTLKCVFRDGKKIIEMSLLLNRGDTDVICAPTHHFCNLGCKMCHLTNNKLNKNMDQISYDDWMYSFKNTINNQNTGVRRTDNKKLLISFMGVGEPLLNLKLIREIYLNECEIKKYGYEHIGYALSTMMPNKNINECIDMVNELKIPLKIHFSLHTPIDNDRHSLIPSSMLDVKECIDLLCKYKSNMESNNDVMKEFKHLHKSNDTVEIHYTLINGVNDGDKQLNIISDILNKTGITIKFIKFNPKNDLQITVNENKWVEYLRNNTISKIKQYTPPGKQVGSSCGEFTKHYYHEEIETDEQIIEFLEWKKNHEIFDC